MGERTSTLLSAIALDEPNFSNKFIYVEEASNADGSFIVSSVIKHQIENENNVIFVLCHNSVGHYQSISQKLGYNLLSLKECGRLVVINILEKIAGEKFIFNENSLKELFNELREQINKWDSCKGVSIVLENFGNLLLIGLKDVLNFINYLRAETIERSNLSLLCLFHNFPDTEEFNLFSKSLRHIADTSVFLKDLSTGRASDISGHLTVKKKINFIRTTCEYQYQLLDKGVHVFAPGCKGFV